MNNTTTGVVIDLTTYRRTRRIEPVTTHVELETEPDPIHVVTPPQVNPWWDDLTPHEANRLLAAEQRAAGKMLRKGVS